MASDRITLVDSIVLLDIVTADPTWSAWSSAALAEAFDHGRVVVNPVVYAEVSVGFDHIEKLDEALPGSMANNPTTYFEDIGATEVVALLDAALAAAPCPEQADQIEDVDAYLDLLQARVEHVARAAGVPRNM